jgi:hypothetical protein
MGLWGAEITSTFAKHFQVLSLVNSYRSFDCVFVLLYERLCLLLEFNLGNNQRICEN